MYSDKAELIRKKYLYRKLILSRSIDLRRDAAVPLVGPDFAYHLYRLTESSSDPNQSPSGDDRQKEG